MKKTFSIILLLIGFLSCMLFFLIKMFCYEIVPILISKLTPSALMCIWLIGKKNKNTNWVLMLCGLSFSFLCDLFMELPNQSFQLYGIISNIVALIFYTLYFVKSCKQHNLFDLLPTTLVIMTLFSVIAPNTHKMFIPIFIYCLFSIVFMWRSITCIKAPGIAPLSKQICVLGSICILCSDSLLSFQMFSILNKSFFYEVLIMILWWIGLLLLTITAGIKEKTE
ncbi:MAG: hypothetical protein GX297_05570 [Treponema sp.]|nr:hypothetical protein [Treponema sp.]